MPPTRQAPAVSIPHLRTLPSWWRRDASPECLGEAIFRHADPGAAARSHRPFPGYVTQPEAILQRTLHRANPDARVLFAHALLAGGGRCAVAHVPVEAGTSLYGTGEQAGPLLRNGIVKTCWNTDAFDYSDRSSSIYQSHPWVLAVRKDGSALGVLFETTARLTIDLRRGITGILPLGRGVSAAPRVTLIERASPALVVQELAKLTGRMPLPPRWALGYHQCRWSYEPDAKVREIAEGFREREIPCDVLWLDIDYMHGFRCFTWDKEKFPDPAKLLRDLHAKGFRVVCMIDPGLKVDPAYHAYAHGLEGNHFVRDANGNVFSGEVWPGDCAFPDFTRERTRRWWAGLYRNFLTPGADASIDGIWNDMNEPAVFKGVQKSMPPTNAHDADESLGGPGPHELFHNVYGMLMAQATREGVLSVKPDKRPFVLTRAGFLGSQRVAATWTGDNRADWRHLRWSISMALNLGLSGQPFAGPDIGGFVGESTPELFARWMGIGAMLPFARGHKIKEARPHEPWALGEACERTCRRALQRRMRLLPHLYTLFRESSLTGLPVARPLFFADPHDPRLRTEDRAFLLGDALLVRCDVEPADSGGHRAGPRCPMPGGDWRPLEPADPAREGWLPDPDLPEVYQRAGTIVPIGPMMQWSDEKPVDELLLCVALDEQGVATGSLYEDAGDGFAHERGEFSLTHWRATRSASGAINVEVVRHEGLLEPVRRVVTAIEVRGAGRR